MADTHGIARDRLERVRSLFIETMKRDPVDRADYLASECGSNVELLAEVESLLNHDSAAHDGFLDPPDFNSPDFHQGVSAERGPRIGSIVGQYRIKSAIADGGMGAVYLAEQAQPPRDVALKILRAGVASRSAMKRFEFESQVLAKLHHPNIAQVYEAGKTGIGLDTVPYFAMEYIANGRTITTYANEEGLKLRQRLQLFARICQAVHHAHQKGIIHRDIKPGNILVDAEGHVKVIDFGIARCTDSDIAATTTQSDVGQLIGTLQYMSPEQCSADALEIDTRSDVYSLGVVLYELLTGHLPYDVSNITIHSATRVICERDPAPPSSYDRRLRGDLETILLKTLDKNRENRYASSESLAEDLERFLRGEPVSVRPQTAWTQCIRWIGRHPLLTTAGLCVSMIAMTFAATKVIVWHFYRQPYRIVSCRDGHRLVFGDRAGADEALLLARDENVLRQWGEGRNSIAFAELVRRPPQFGEGSLALIGFSEFHAGALAKTLCAYAADDDTLEPVWHHGVDTGQILKTLSENRNFDGGRFAIREGLIADIFPGVDHPGNEIVAVFACDLSPRIIRIYDLNGLLLYEAWHDGTAIHPYWLQDAGLLLFAGDDHQRNWDEFGNPKSKEQAPLAAFALRPSSGSINRSGFMNSNAALSILKAGEHPSGLVWYRWLYQEGARPTSYSENRLTLGRAFLADSAKFVSLIVDNSSDGQRVSWTIDASGMEVPNSRSISQDYKRARKSNPQNLPDPYEFRLGDTPPFASPTVGGAEP